jgi:hypothetical protein
MVSKLINIDCQSIESWRGTNKKGFKRLISMHGARDGCTGLNKSCLARLQMTNRQGVALSISAILQNVLSGTVVGNVLGVCYACYVLKTYIY